MVMSLIPKITDQNHLDKFAQCSSRQQLIQLLQTLYDAIKGVPLNGLARIPELVVWDELFCSLENTASSTELVPTPRFGNPAFRTWHNQVVSTQLTPERLHPLLPAAEGILVEEVSAYIGQAFGDPQGLSYGTGHELHFFIALLLLTHEDAGLICQNDKKGAQAIVAQMVMPYLTTVRCVQEHFRLEPAGSHGVWGLDDYHHIPFILGAAQLCGHEQHISTSAVLDRTVSEDLSSQWIYFGMIAWIHAHKKGGSLSVHSGVLASLQDFEDWTRIYHGMIKMFEGEILNKLPVMSHLLFGVYFRFEPPETMS